MTEFEFFHVLKPILVSGGKILNLMRGSVTNKPKESDLPPELVKESSTAHTDIDDLVQEVALEILYSHLPNIAVNAEEKTERVKWFKTDKTRLCFHLDPLDGTLAYTKNRDDFAIGAAISKNLKFIASGIYFPARDELFYAERGKGVIVINSLGKTISFTRPSTPEKKFVQKRCDEFLPVLEKLGLSKLDSMSAHNTMISILEGKASMQMYHMASPHDFGIPQVILEEGGGICTDLDGKPIKYDKDFSRVPYFLAFFDENVKDEYLMEIRNSKN